MHRLRSPSHLGRLVLLWFVLALGAAAATPLVRPQAMQLVCSATGTMMLVAPGDDTAVPVGGKLPFDCPLCVVSAAPPPAALPGPTPFPGIVHRARHAAADPLAERSAAALPARGPPAFS